MYGIYFSINFLINCNNFFTIKQLFNLYILYIYKYRINKRTKQWACLAWDEHFQVDFKSVHRFADRGG